LLLLLLAPGFWYVTYQNYENEPQWLILLAILLWALRPASDPSVTSGWDMRMKLSGAALIAAALIAPTVVNMTYSPFRHMQAKADTFTPILQNQPQHSDFQLTGARVFRMDKRVPYAQSIEGGSAYNELAKREDLATWQGEEFAYCGTDVGFPNWFSTMAAQLESNGFAGAKILMTDVLSPLQLFGDFQPLQGGAPWYYGGLKGLPDAGFVLVPLCPIADDTRRMMLDEMAEINVPLVEADRTDLYVLYAVDR